MPARTHLSPAMRAAVIDAMAPDGTLTDTQQRTEIDLIRRGLAYEVRGKYTDRRGNTVYSGYLGARLTDKGKQLQADLLAETTRST